MAVPTPGEVYAYTGVNGQPNYPAKELIIQLLDYMLTLASTNTAFKLYATKAALDADTGEAAGTVGIVWNDPVLVNNYPTLWVWDGSAPWERGPDRLAGLDQSSAQALAAVNGLYDATGAARPVAWMDSSSYEVAWLASLTNIDTRITVTPSVNGLTIVGLAALPGVQPIAVRLPTDIVPGDRFTIKAAFTGGTVTSSTGFMFGVDTATSGNLSTNSRSIVRRGTSLVPSLSNGSSSDAARTTTAPFTGLPITFSAPAFVTGTQQTFIIDVQSDYSLFVKAYQDGQRVATNVIVSPAVDGSLAVLHGRIIVGVVMSTGQTVTISSVARSSVPASTLYVHSGVSSSGDGTRGAPLKSLTDIAPAMVSQGLVGKPINITFLTDNVYGYLEPDDTLSPRWTVNGLPGGNTALNGFNFNEIPVYTVVAATSGKVWTTPLKHALEVASHPNQVFVTNLSWNPRPWYQFPHTALVTRTTANGGVDMQGDTAGSTASQGGLLYVRLPDGLPSADPNAYPTGGFGLVVARTLNLIAVKGAPEIICNNLTLRWASGSLFAGGSGFGVFTNCIFEWSGYNTPTVEVQNGQYEFNGGHTKYSDGDGIGRTPRIDTPYQNGSTLTTKVRNFEISHTGSQAGASGGDAISDHVFDVSLDPGLRRSILYLENVYFHDCWKCGVVTSDDEVHVNGITVERCGTAQFALLGVPTAPAVGRTQRAIVNGFRFDPQGLGSTGVWNVYTDGMALCEMNLTNGWIGTPAAGGQEFQVDAVALSGQTRDISKNVVRYTNVTTERDPGSVVKNGAGLATGLLTFSGNPANGDTVTIGAVTYTFNTTLGGANSVLIGGSSLVTRNNLIGAIMRDPLLIGTGYGSATAVHPTVTALAAVGNVALKAKTAGTGGNAIVTTEVSAALSFGAGTLTGGVAASGTFVPVTAYPLT